MDRLRDDCVFVKEVRFLSSTWFDNALTKLLLWIDNPQPADVAVFFIFGNLRRINDWKLKEDDQRNRSSPQNILFQIYRIPFRFLIIRTLGCIYRRFRTVYNPPWKFRRTMFESSRPCNVWMRNRQFFIKKRTKRPRNNIFSQKWTFSFRFWKAESFWLYRGGI